MSDQPQSATVARTPRNWVPVKDNAVHEPNLRVAIDELNELFSGAFDPDDAEVVLRRVSQRLIRIADNLLHGTYLDDRDDHYNRKIE